MLICDFCEGKAAVKTMAIGFQLFELTSKGRDCGTNDTQYNLEICSACAQKLRDMIHVKDGRTTLDGVLSKGLGLKSPSGVTSELAAAYCDK